MALKILKQQAETPVQQAGSRLFPAGIWKGELLTPTGSRTRATPDFMHNAATTPEGKSPRVAGDTGEILSIWIGNNEALAEGQDNPGKQIYFQDFVIRDGILEIMELDTEDENSGAGWQIQRDARLLANLAIALGATVEDGDYVSVADNFVQMLQDGEFDGQVIQFEVKHSPWKNKVSGKSGVNVEIIQFTPAA